VTDSNFQPESWSEHPTVQAPAVQVTFFEDRAEVVRRASVHMPQGRS